MKILLTSVGCPGASTLIKMLKANHVEVHGCDMEHDVIGRWLCESFHDVPPGRSPGYVTRIQELAKKLDVDAVLPESDYELLSLAKGKDEFPCPVLVSNPEEIEIVQDKGRMYERLIRQGYGEKLPLVYTVNTFWQLEAAADKISPENTVPYVVKPTIGKGSRGVRIINPRLDPYQHLVESKPDNKEITPTMLKQLFLSNGRSKHTVFDREYMVMEYLGETQETVDIVSDWGEIKVSSVKTVEKSRWGVVTLSTLIKRPELVKQTEQIIGRIPLAHCINVQFIGEKLVEINARVSSYVHQKTVCFPYLALREACGMSVNWELEQKKVRIGRRMIRYMDQVFEG